MPRKKAFGLVMNSEETGYILRIGRHDCCIVDRKDVVFLDDGTARVRAGAPIRKVFSYSTMYPVALEIPESFKRRFDAAHVEMKAQPPMGVAMRIVQGDLGVPQEELRRRKRARART